ncbi:hypothetical protein CRG98_045753 [Punica granatum]|uniref:Uncharacterized protein n=1 Tax=Punica granatum TaxID=22663 RepID=A0A2I0HQ68_PUNGR|nr:hypothetical protein CRG98_045753 [Punica granatum]
MATAQVGSANARASTVARTQSPSNVQASNINFQNVDASTIYDSGGSYAFLAPLCTGSTNCLIYDAIAPPASVVILNSSMDVKTLTNVKIQGSTAVLGDARICRATIPVRMATE